MSYHASTGEKLYDLAAQLVGLVLAPFVMIALWVWFAVPLGMSPLPSWWHAYGLWVLIRFIIDKDVWRTVEPATETEYLLRATMAWLTPVVALGAGWLLSRFT